MATLTLLTNAEYVKGYLAIDANLSEVYLRTAMTEAQEVGLREILGGFLLESLKAKVNQQSLAGYYATLVELCQPYLAYKSVAELLPKISYKVTNMGVVKTSDDKVSNATREEIDAQIALYQSKADAECFKLQKWVLANRNQFSELSDYDCSQIKSNLYSAASCGIFLGGRRGIK